MKISLIAAMSENRVIGIGQKLPWNIPLDLKRFRSITKGHPCVMGRKTFESIKRPLPDRPNIIVTRQKGYKVEGAVVVDSIDAALQPFENTQQEVFILGGGDIFTQTLAIADMMYLTMIHQVFDGDAFFPTFDHSQFEVVFREDHQEPLPFSFIDFRRTVKTLNDA